MVLYAPVFYSSILKGIISPVWLVLLKCVELKYIAFIASCIVVGGSL